MEEQGTRVDRLVSIDVVERFEALQDEVDLLKNEIKQTLVDLREHLMKDRTVFSEPEAGPQARMPSPLQPRVVYTKEPFAEAERNQPMLPVGHFAPGAQADRMDPVILGNVINWLGTVKEMGVSLQQVTPFLEAYEASGYLPPIMLKVLLRALADLDQMTDSPPEDEFSPRQYADCIGQLHDIICAAKFEEELPLPAPELSEANSETNSEFERVDVDEPKGNIDVQRPIGAVYSAADNYNLTTIQVPDLQVDLESPETGGRYG